MEAKAVQQIDEICRHGKDLTKWEEDFIESMQDKVEMYGDRVLFTESQIEVIRKIHTERIP